MALQAPIKELKQKVKMKKTVSDDLKPFVEQAKNLHGKYIKEAEPGSFHMTLPGSKYIGPGNSLNEGAPVNNADSIAFLHDWAYALAKRPEEVHEADIIAINYFDKEFKQSGNWQALVGEMGLCVKHFVELKLGRVLYPTLNPGSETSGKTFRDASEETNASSSRFSTRSESEVDEIPTLGSRSEKPANSFDASSTTPSEAEHNSEELKRKKVKSKSRRRSFIVRFCFWILDFLRGRVCICGCHSARTNFQTRPDSFSASSTTMDEVDAIKGSSSGKFKKSRGKANFKQPKDISMHQHTDHQNAMIQKQ